MLLAVEEGEYIRVPSKVTKAGVKVGIFPFGKPANIEDDAIDIMPGQSTNMRLSAVSTTVFLICG